MNLTRLILLNAEPQDKRDKHSVRSPVGRAAGAPLNEEPCCVRPG